MSSPSVLNERLQHLDEVVRRNQPQGKAMLIAVTKYASLEQTRRLFASGVRHFGENKVQDALSKKEALREDSDLISNVAWHFIGHLQSNKVNKVVGEFDWIHSVDSLALAEKISTRARDLGIRQKVLFQVNISAEESKSGFAPDDFLAAYAQLLALPNLELAGLMTIAQTPGVDSSPMSPAEVFARLAELFARCSELIQDESQRLAWKELSMGMSQDYETALSHGATMIRIGNFLVSAS